MIKLRPAQPADYPAIAALHADSWRRTYRGIYSDTFLDHDLDRNRSALWQGRLSAPAANQHVTLAVEQEKLIGFACLYLDDDPAFGALLDNIHVSASFQKSGIGRLLMTNCVHLVAEKATVKTLYLWVFEANQNAINAYERLGGTRVETVLKINEDGSEARICRYVWNDLTSIF